MLSLVKTVELHIGIITLPDGQHLATLRVMAKCDHLANALAR